MDANILAKRLKELREQNNWTQRELAEMANVTPATISAYENGAKNPSLTIIESIARTANSSIDWLCGLSEEQQSSTVQIRTYSDVIRVLLGLSKKFYTKIRVTTDKTPTPDTYDVEWGTFLICNAQIVQFFKEWQKIKRLYDENTIDEDLYSAWIEKQLRVYEKEINREDIDDEFELPF